MKESKRVWMQGKSWCRRMPPSFLTLAFVLLVALIGCAANLTQSEAETKAISFVEDYAIVYTNDSSQIADYSVEVVESASITDDWLVTIEVSSTLNGTRKRANIDVLVDGASGATTLLVNE